MGLDHLTRPPGSMLVGISGTAFSSQDIPGLAISLLFWRTQKQGSCTCSHWVPGTEVGKTNQKIVPAPSDYRASWGGSLFWGWGWGLFDHTAWALYLKAVLKEAWEHVSDPSGSFEASCRACSGPFEFWDFSVSFCFGDTPTSSAQGTLIC